MSTCARPKRKRKTNYAQPGAIVAAAPQAKFLFCAGGTNGVITAPGTTTTTIQCCPPSEPPVGSALLFKDHGNLLGVIKTLNVAGDLIAGSISGTEGTITGTKQVIPEISPFLLKRGGTVLGAITELDFLGHGWKIGITGTTGVIESTFLVWEGNWVSGWDYHVNDLVHAEDGNGYVCITDHTSADVTKPNHKTNPNSAEWSPVTTFDLPVSTMEFIENLANGVFDWMKNATVGDWVEALATGAGILIAGAALKHIFDDDGDRENHDSSYTGTPGTPSTGFTPPPVTDVLDGLGSLGGGTTGNPTDGTGGPGDIGGTLDPDTDLVVDEPGGNVTITPDGFDNLPPQVNEDANGNGVLDPGEDLDGDGVLDLGQGEDLDGDGVLDPSEDTNGNGVLDPGEDLDGDGVLDLGEDTNGNGVLDVTGKWIYVDYCYYDGEGKEVCVYNKPIFITGPGVTVNVGHTNLVPGTLKVTTTQIGGIYGNGSLIDMSNFPSDFALDFTIANPVSIRTILNNIALISQFDIIPSGGILKFVPKYQPPVRVLTLDDLSHSSGERASGSAPYSARRHQGIDLPHSVTMVYNSHDYDHNQFAQTSTMDFFTEGQIVKFEMPFTLTDEYAKKIVETSLVNAHIEQMEYVFTTDYHNIDLEPGDVVTIPLDSGGTTDVRITEIRESEDGLLEFISVRSDHNTITYVAGQVAPVHPPATGNTVKEIGASNGIFLDLPILPGADTDPVLHIAVHGYGKSGWPGCVIYKSSDGGESYQNVGSVGASKEAVWGMVDVATTGSTATADVWDTTTVITVELKTGSLQTKSDAAILGGQNWAMIGGEMIAFVNATLVGPKTYQLTRLLRGRQGTELFCGSHVADELFVLINESIFAYKMPVSDIGKSYMWKFVTIGSDISKTDPITVASAGISLRPWAPANLKAVLNTTTGSWNITWIERPRYNNELRPYNEITHDPDWAGFAISIFANSTFNTSQIKRSVIQQTTSFNYTEAMQQQDFGADQTHLYVAVQQLSTLVGGGYAAKVSV